MGVTRISIFPGTNPEASPEDVAKAVRLSLEEVMSGASEPLDI
jgi:hypothetical protein